MPKTSKPKKSVYEIVTEKLIALLESGVVPWAKNWIGGAGNAPANFASKKAYRGINILMLACQGYSSQWWLTFKQAQEVAVQQAKKAGRKISIRERSVTTRKGTFLKKYFWDDDKDERFVGGVRKGEKGTIVVYFTLLHLDANGRKVATREEAVKSIPFLRYSTVFNQAQIEGIEFPAPEDVETFDHSPIEECERIIAGMPNPPTIKITGGQPCYVPVLDEVRMPALEQYKTPESFYKEHFHELAHATGHKSRLDREGVTDGARFGSEKYGKEELIAEMAAAFLAGHAGISVDEQLNDSASYLGSWIKTLKGDPKLAVQAASAAQKAADYVLGVVAKDESAKPVAKPVAKPEAVAA